MKRKTIALFMLVSMISAGTLFAGRASAKNDVTVNNASTVKGAIARIPRLSATNAGVLANYTSGLAAVTFQNYTPWNIQCYVDGTFVGVVYPGRELSSVTGSGWNRPYAQAVFVNGAVIRWDLGNVFYQPGGNYVFPMFP
jgi:hypothetical protein